MRVLEKWLSLSQCQGFKLHESVSVFAVFELKHKHENSKSTFLKFGTLLQTLLSVLLGRLIFFFQTSEKKTWL